MSRGRFPLSGGNGRRPKGVGMMSRSDRGDRDRCPRRGRMRGQVSEWVCYTQGVSPPAGGEFLCPWRQRNQNATGDGSGWTLRVHIRRPPRTPITGVTPWSRQNPSGVQNLSDDLNPRRPTGAWVCKNCSCCGSTTTPGFAEPTCLVQNMGYLIRPLRGHLPLKGKAFKWHPPAFPFRGRWHAKRDG